MSVSAIPVSARAGYDLWAPHYALDANPLLALQQRRMEPMLPPIRDRRIVDLACGTGRWLDRLAARAPRYFVGIDFSFGMLQRAGKLPQLAGHISCGDCSSLPLRDRSADVVLCSLALDHIPDLEGFAREAARIADDDAIFLLSEFHPDAHARGWKRTFQNGETTFELEVTPRNLREVREVFEAAGFWLEQHQEPCFGEPERRVFIDAGREDLFERVRDAGPALFISRYVRCRRRSAQSFTRSEVTLVNARVAAGPDTAMQANVAVEKGSISEICDAQISSRTELDLSGYMLLPGLVNAHDHLEFSLYPRLGRGPYGNAREWAADIYRPTESPIREHRRIPKAVRLWWGALKNLLCGVTTVSHHNPHSAVFWSPDFPVRVLSRFGWAHSFGEEPDVELKLRRTSPGSPFLIHLAEGTDEIAASEFKMLSNIGALDSRTVIVHGVGLKQQEHEHLQSVGGAIVWCPSSNHFLLDTTLPTSVVESCSRVALGNDSCLTAVGDLLDEIRFARACGASPRRLYEMVTSLAANVLNTGSGAVLPNTPADLIAVRDRGLSPAETLAQANHADIELVLIAGRVRLISRGMLSRWTGKLPPMERIVVAGVERFVAAPVREMLETTRVHLGDDIRLAGKQVRL